MIDGVSYTVEGVHREKILQFLPNLSSLPIKLSFINTLYSRNGKHKYLSSNSRQTNHLRLSASGFYDSGHTPFIIANLAHPSRAHPKVHSGPEFFD